MSLVFWGYVLVFYSLFTSDVAAVKFPTFSWLIRCCIQEGKGCPTTTTTPAPDFDCVPRCVEFFSTEKDTCLWPLKLSKFTSANRPKSSPKRKSMKHFPSIKISQINLAGSSFQGVVFNGTCETARFLLRKKGSPIGYMVGLKQRRISVAIVWNASWLQFKIELRPFTNKLGVQ